VKKQCKKKTSQIWKNKKCAHLAANPNVAHSNVTKINVVSYVLLFDLWVQSESRFTALSPRNAEQINIKPEVYLFRNTGYLAHQTCHSNMQHAIYFLDKVIKKNSIPLLYNFCRFLFTRRSCVQQHVLSFYSFHCQQPNLSPSAAFHEIAAGALFPRMATKLHPIFTAVAHVRYTTIIR